MSPVNWIFVPEMKRDSLRRKRMRRSTITSKTSRSSVKSTESWRRLERLTPNLSWESTSKHAAQQRQKRTNRTTVGPPAGRVHAAGGRLRPPRRTPHTNQSKMLSVISRPAYAHLSFKGVSFWVQCFLCTSGGGHGGSRPLDRWVISRDGRALGWPENSFSPGIKNSRHSSVCLLLCGQRFQTTRDGRANRDWPLRPSLIPRGSDGNIDRGAHNHTWQTGHERHEGLR